MFLCHKLQLAIPMFFGLTIMLPFISNLDGLS